MKKLILCILFCCFCLSGCSKIYNLTKKNLAEIRYNIFTGDSDNFHITFMSGQREKDYVINGYNSELINFGVVTISLKNETLDTTNSNFALTINTLRYEDILEKNPFDGTLVADIGTIVDNEIKSITIKVFIDKIIEEITLTNISYNWNVDYNDALKIACKSLSEELTPLLTNEFLGEAYIKIIEDTIENKDNYLWYVNFVSRNGIQHSIIIDPITSKVLAKK